MKNIFLLFSLAAVLAVSFFVFSGRLSGDYLVYEEYGDEVNYIRFSTLFQKLKAEGKTNWREELLSVSKGVSDLPVGLFYLINARLSAEEKGYLLNAIRKNPDEDSIGWDFELSREENERGGMGLPPGIMRSARSLSLGAGVLSCAVLYLLLWISGARISALAAALLFIFNPLMISHSLMVVPEVFLLFFSSLALLFFLGFYNGIFGRYRLAAACIFPAVLFTGAAILIKLTAAVFLLCFWLFLLAMFFVKTNHDPRKKKMLCALFLLALPLTVFISSYIFQPVVRLYPWSGWLKMFADRLSIIAAQARECCNYGLALKDKLVLVPERIAVLSVPFSAAGWARQLFLLSGGSLFLIGIFKGFRGLTAVNKDPLRGTAFILAYIYLAMAAALLVFLHCDWPRYYLLCVYYGYLIMGIGLGELEKLFFRLRSV